MKSKLQSWLHECNINFKVFITTLSTVTVDGKPIIKNCAIYNKSFQYHSKKQTKEIYGYDLDFDIYGSEIVDLYLLGERSLISIFSFRPEIIKIKILKNDEVWVKLINPLYETEPYKSFLNGVGDENENKI
jgi:hypothetical protein